MEYNVGDVVRCMWGSKPVEYEAKIVRANFASKEYFVHYQGWNKRYDEWISEKSILGASKKQQTPSRCDTPKIRHSRREKKTKKPIDWSPTPCASAHIAEKPAPQKVPNKQHVPISTKRKHSPASKTKKPAHTSPDLATVDDLTEESVTSDEEYGDYPLPRSYIDVLAKAKKRAERKAQQKMSPNETTFKSTKVASTFMDRNQEEADCGSLHSAQPESETSLSLATASSDDVSSTSMECNGVTVSSVGGDHNYSSLRFHYDDDTPPPSAAEKTRANDQVTSSTRRVHILPVRKPLDIEYTLPYSPSAFKFAKVSSSTLIARPPMIGPTRRPRVDNPPNLGSPFTYRDEYRSPLPISMECDSKGICGERATAASNFLNVDISDSVTTSSSYSESEDSLSSRPQITGPKSVSPFTVST
uniref:Chromo domain-containing protein n=1 Tax=Haemonchus contortus TaxID=6289 RepID=A0A7I5EBR5_HAECO